MKTCSKCGSKIPTDTKYCESCGTKQKNLSTKLVVVISAVTLLLAGCIGAILWPKQPPVSDPEEDVEVVDTLLCTHPENVLQKIKKTGILRVSVESEALPFNYISKETGKPEGFEYELICNVAQEMGIDNVELVWTNNYDDIPNMICKERDQADIFMGGYIANPNIPHVSWSDSYYEDGYCLIVPIGSAITRLKDLKGKRIGVYNEDASEEFVQENVDYPQAIYRFEDEDEDGTWMMTHLLDHLAKRKKCQVVDAIIYDYVFAKEEIKASEGQLKIVAFNLNKLSYQIGLPKNNYELLKEVNRALGKVMDSPIYVQLVKKYLDFDASNVSLSPLDDNIRKHIVAAGETLGSIAQMELGDSNRWVEIWEINKMRIPNPHLIHPKNELIIP